MNSRCPLVVLAFFCGVASAEDSVVLGRSLGHMHIEEAEINCPPEYICMDAWFRWTIKPEKTVAGPKLSGRITAARIQHTEFVRSYERTLRLFILTPIEDAEQRALLKADYLLRDVSAVHEMYCVRNSIDLGIEADEKLESEDGERYCFELPRDDQDG